MIFFQFIIFLSIFPFPRSLIIPISFTAQVRPGSIFQHPFDNYVSDIYIHFNLYPNKTIKHFVFSEKDYLFHDSTLPSYEIYINSINNYVYYVHDEKCVKTPIQNVYSTCLYIPSFITGQYLYLFSIDDPILIDKNVYCPGHTNENCNHWYDKLADITIFSVEQKLKSMILSGILYKPIFYDNFTEVGFIANFSEPTIECEYNRSFPLCDFY